MKNKKNNSLLNKQRMNNPNLRTVENPEGTEDTQNPPVQEEVVPPVDGQVPETSTPDVTNPDTNTGDTTQQPETGDSVTPPNQDQNTPPSGEQVPEAPEQGTETTPTPDEGKDEETSKEPEGEDQVQKPEQSPTEPGQGETQPDQGESTPDTDTGTGTNPDQGGTGDTNTQPTPPTQEEDKEEDTSIPATPLQPALGCNSKYGCKHPDKPSNANIHSECQVETVLPNPGQPGEGLIPPYQPPMGEPGSGSETEDNNMGLYNFTIMPHSPLEVSVGTPIVIQISTEDKKEISNLLITAKDTGVLRVTKEHEDPTIYTIHSAVPVNTSLVISADGYMPTEIPVKFLEVNFTATPSKTKVREKESFTIDVSSVLSTDQLVASSDTEDLSVTVKSNQLVECVYNKNNIKPGETKEVIVRLKVANFILPVTITVIPEIDILTLNFTPGASAYYNEEITLNVTGTEEDLTVEASTEKITVVKESNTVFKLKVTEPSYGKITVRGPNVKPESEQVIFKDQKLFQIIPHTPLTVSMEQPILLEVISKSGEDIANVVMKSKKELVNIKKTSKEGHTNLFEITPKDTSVDILDTVVVSSTTDTSVPELEQEINFSTLKIAVKQNQKYFRVKKLNSLTVTGLKDTDEIKFTCDLEGILIRRVNFDTFEVALNKSLGRFDTVRTTITFIVNGHRFGHAVEFYPEFDTLSFNFFPSNKVKYTSEVTVEVEGAKGVVDLKTDHPSVNIRRIGDPIENRFIVDSTVITEALITAYGTEVESKATTIFFIDNEEALPMETEYEVTRVTSTDKTFEIKIKNVMTPALRAKSPSFKIKPLDIVYRRDHVAIAKFELSDYIERPIETVVNFYIGEKVVLEAPVEIRLPKPKEPFGCDKLSLQGYVTSAAKPNGISVGIPFLNTEKDFICQGETEAFNSKVTITQMANRLVIKADEPCRGRILLKHPDYIDSHIDVEFIEYNPNVPPIIVENKDDLIQEALSLGLEYKNDMSVRYDPDLFVGEVISFRNILDKQKVGYIYVNGSVSNRTTVKFFTTFEKSHGVSNTFLGAEAVARDIFNLYNVIKKTLYIVDYYTFREEFLLLIQMFKTFKDSSLNLLRIYRFEDKWKGSPQDLDKYKLITTLMTKYIEQNGKNMNQYVKPLRSVLPSFIVDNLDKFTGEEIYV